ncbi:MAG: hypothetical protein P9L90_05425 [Candidatus Aadella gelida]|nr:hypothetical protein [Candidatus Aadella gelida]
MDNKVERILAEYDSNKKPGKSCQKSIAVKENLLFKGELEKVKSYLGKPFFRVKKCSNKVLREYAINNPLMKWDYPEKEEVLKSAGYSAKKSLKNKQRFNRKLAVYETDYLEWRRFCERWDIKPAWNGELKKLEEYVKDSVLLGTMEYGTVGKKSVFLELDSWAKQDDIKRRWKQIEALQKSIHTDLNEGKAKMNRDISWYKLNKELGWSLKRIAELWLTSYPEEVDVLVLRRMKKNEDINLILKDLLDETVRGKSDRKEVKALGNMIDEAEKLKLLKDDITLLECVKSGKLSEKVKKYFYAEREEYISGIRGRKKAKGESPLNAAIRKAVKRVEKDIFAKKKKEKIKETPFKITYVK